MKRKRLMWVIILITLIPSIRTHAKQAIVVQVGITDFRKVESSYAKYTKLFEELANAAGKDQPITFRFAIGTDNEVLDWFNKGLIDVAVLQAMPVADLLSSFSEDEKKQLEEDYIGDLADLPERKEDERAVGLHQDSAAEKNPDYYFKYRTNCIVSAADEELKSFSDIQKLASAGKVKFLFVRPFSMTGYVVPYSFLLEKRIEPTKEQLDFTFQHSNSLKRLMKPLPEDEGKHLVAFVIDSTPYKYDPQDPAKEIFRKIDAPGLENYLIPHEVVLVNHNLKKYQEGNSSKFDRYKSLMEQLFRSREANMRSNRGLTSRFIFRSKPGSWINNYNDVRNAIKRVNLPRQLLNRSSFEEMTDDWSRWPIPPRIALVLSGGGAKCAYQAGAIQEIERKLKEKKLDIGLVVGTSGGAINALLVALGVTKDENAGIALSETWQSFEQRDFFQPSLLFNFVFGLAFGLLQALLITLTVLLFGQEHLNWRKMLLVLGLIGLAEAIALLYFDVSRSYVWALFSIQIATFIIIITGVRLFRGLHNAIVRRFQAWISPGKRNLNTGAMVNYSATEARTGMTNLPPGERWWRLAGWMMVAVSTIEILIANAPQFGRSLSALSVNHWIHHFSMIITLSSLWSAPWPFLLGAAMVISGWKMFPPFDWNARRDVLIQGMVIGLVVISSLLIMHSVFKETSPSSATGIEQAFETEIPKVIRYLKPDFSTSSEGDIRMRLENTSRQIIASDLLKRDLVITASRLPSSDRELQENLKDYEMSANQLNEDLYFYYRSGTVMPPLDKRFIPFNTNREKLLDVVIGSSTIYPLFPARTLTNVQVGSEDLAMKTVPEMKIIDGGFIHNVPIDAAIKWGATHVVLIEASPNQPAREPTNFLENAYVAFVYLFTQAQRSDILAQSSVEVFKLQPTSPCDKLNARSNCSDDPEPNMDTFDFSKEILERAYNKGVEDARGPKPLFIRLPGLPLFRDVTAGPSSASMTESSVARVH